jgi:hypothetical protein
MEQTVTDQLRELARDWGQAVHNDAMGMGSATPRSARAIEDAGNAFMHALAKARAQDVANALLYEPADWCIWSFGHSAWWRPNKAGYTTRAPEAGKYERAEVLWILSTSTPGDNVPVHERNCKDDIWPAVTAR